MQTSSLAEKEAHPEGNPVNMKILLVKILLTIGGSFTEFGLPSNLG
jgi:hypothetical protein